MKPLRLLSFLAIAFVLMISAVMAESKYWPRLGWPESHWRPFTPEQPYLKGPKIPHAHLWHGGEWRPQDWARDPADIEAVIERFYRGDIIRRQTSEDDVPVLVAGQGFMALSSRDKRRVAAFMDYAYGITWGENKTVLKIRHYEDKTPIGVYTQNGLQLQ